MNHQANKTSKRRKYPGFRPCLNHDHISEMLKNPVPELCPKCFAGIARHQIQLIALHDAKLYLIMNRVIDVINELEELRSKFNELKEKVTP